MKSNGNLLCQGTQVGKLYIVSPSRLIPNFLGLALVATRGLAVLSLSIFISFPSPPTLYPSATESPADTPADPAFCHLNTSKPLYPGSL